MTHTIRPEPLCPKLITLAEKSSHFFSHLAADATWDQRRASYLAMSQAFVPDRPADIVSRDETITAPASDIRCRVYTCEGGHEKPGAGNAAFVYFHGGGFTYGSIESHDTVVADLVKATGLTGFSIEYRLAPEHRCPAAFSDAVCAYEAIHANASCYGVDPDRILLAGDSAGATLAAGTAIRQALDNKAPQPKGLVLIYPVLGLDFDTESYRRNANAPMLTRHEMLHYWGVYLGHAATQPHTGLPPGAIPNDMLDLPEGVPAAAISVAAHDPVCDDGVVFYHRLSPCTAGCSLDVRPNLPHGHLRARDVSPSAQAAFSWIASEMSRLAGP